MNSKDAIAGQPPPSRIRRYCVSLAILAAIVLLAGLLLCAFYPSRHTEAEDHFALAEAAVARNDLPEACEHLRQLLELHPGSAAAHFLFAQSHRREGRFDDAAADLNEAAMLGWDSAAVAREANLARLQSEQVAELSTPELFTMLRSSRTLDTGMLEAFYRGDLTARNWDRAGYWLHLWLEDYPGDWLPRLWQAELLERFKKYDRARDDYLLVLNSRPDQRRALLGVGLIAVANRADYSEAELYLNQYLALNPNHAEAALGLARCAFGRGDLAEARRRALQVQEAHPGNAGVALLLGQIESESGHDAQAEVWLRQAEAGGADKQSVAYHLAQVLTRLNRKVDAEGYSRRFAELRERNAAVERAVRMAEREPKNADLQYEVGRLTLLTGEEELAAQWFLLAIKLDPKHQRSHAALSEHYSKQPGPKAAAKAESHRRAAAAK